MSVLIRPATEADLVAIRDVGRVTWPETYAFGFEDDLSSAHNLDQQSGLRVVRCDH